jgi:hypothetical protein
MWLDGPLLSEYVHPHGDRFLYCWSDCNAKATRWMVMRVAEQTILRLANGMLPLDFVITRACQDDFVYFIDVLAGTRKDTEIWLSRVEDVPPEYLPQKGVFLDEAEPAGDGTYTVLLDESWNPTDLFVLPKSFEQAYSFLHAHLQLQVPTLEKLPWRGGFSSMHFDTWVRRTIPSQDRLGVDKVMVASPGFIRFKADDETAGHVAQCVLNVSERPAARATYDAVTDFIKKNIPQTDTLTQIDWPTIDPRLIEYTNQLARDIGAINPGRLLASVRTPFEAVQILRWFYRRLHPMVGFHRAQKLTFTTERP